MRVLIVYHAGATEHPRRIFQAMAQDDNVKLTVVVPEKLKVDNVYDPSGWLCVGRESNSDGFRLMPIALRNPYEYRRGFDTKPLDRVIEQTRPDIIHVLDEPTSGYLRQVVCQQLMASKRPRILFYGYENIRICRNKLTCLRWRLMWTQVSGGAAANTEHLEKLKRAGFPPNRPLRRIFWGIATDTFKPMDGATLKKELNLGYEYIVGFVGRLVPEKGLTTLVAAMRQLSQNLHCVVIGSGPMREELDLWSKSPDFSGRLHILDAMKPEALARYMNCMDVLAVPSLTTKRWKEQYGRVIAEAMACGVPVVGSDSGAIPEVIGTAGLIVPEGNPDALAQALQSVILDKKRREHLIASGMQRAREELSVTAMVQQLLKLYSLVLEKND